MAQFLKIYKKTALSWWFEVDGNGELRTISDFEVNIGNSFNIVEIDGSKIFINNIANITIIDETNASANFTYINPFLLEQKLRDLNFVPYRIQTPSGGSQNLSQVLAIGNTANNDILLGIQSPSLTLTKLSFDKLQIGDFSVDRVGGFNLNEGLDAGASSRNSKFIKINADGIKIKTNTLDRVSSNFKNDNVTASAIFQAPNTPAGEFTTPISVNGILAGVDGDIVVPDSGIVDAPAIPGTGTTIMTFDKLRYHGLTNQTGNIVLELNPAIGVNKNGRVQVLDINGTPPYTLSHLANSVNSNGVAFDNTKNNVIYYDNVNGKLKYNITLQNLPDVVAPTLVSAVVKNANPSNIELTYIEPLTASPLPSFTDFVLNLSKTVTNIAIAGNIVTLTVNAPYVSGNMPTFNYTGGINKIKDLAGNIAGNLVGQVVTNNFGLICLDDFNSVNRTDLAGRRTTFPTVGYLWLKAGAGTGTLGIVSNSLKNTGAVLDINNIYYFNLGNRNLDISLTYKTVGTLGNSNLEFARVNDGERYYLRSDMQLRKVIGGVNTLVSAIGGTLANSDVVRCVLTNAVIEVYKNEVQVYTGASDPAITGTHIGIYVYQDDVVEFDNLIIY